MAHTKTQSADRGGQDDTAAEPQAERHGKRDFWIQSLAFGLRVLETVFASRKERGVTDLSKQMGLSKWQIFRHVHTLCDEGFLVRNADTERFGVGRRTYDMMGQLPNRLSFSRRVRDAVEQLSEKLGHTVTLSRVIDDERVMVVDAEIGAMCDLHASAQGKVALAFSGPQRLAKVLARPLTVYTEHTIAEPKALARHIERVRRQGWATAPEETIRGVNALAAPIFSGDHFHGCISVLASIDDLPRQPPARDVEAVVAAARSVSED